MPSYSPISTRVRMEPCVAYRKLLVHRWGWNCTSCGKNTKVRKQSRPFTARILIKFEMVMQAYEYERAHLTHKMGFASETENDSRTLLQPLRTFYITTNTSMKSPLFKRLDGELRDKREVLLLERGWDVTNVERQAY
mmetsp:Transcript_59012/g.71027  ORF Transcript_59012/g.71027 Transcript_59012/m.71027 type:complete len:137 (-) Transcript_59012:97-507(-)